MVICFLLQGNRLESLHRDRDASPDSRGRISSSVETPVLHANHGELSQQRCPSYSRTSCRVGSRSVSPSAIRRRCTDEPALDRATHQPILTGARIMVVTVAPLTGAQGAGAGVHGLASAGSTWVALHAAH